MENNMQIVPVNTNVEAQFVEMRVPLYSYGCEKKVKKAVSHLKGIYSVDVDYKLQKVTVWGICNKFDVLSTIRSKRKETRLWDSEETLPITSISEPRKRAIPMMIRSLSWKWAIKKMIRSTSF